MYSFREERVGSAVEIQADGSVVTGEEDKQDGSEWVVAGRIGGEAAGAVSDGDGQVQPRPCGVESCVCSVDMAGVLRHVLLDGHRYEGSEVRH